MGRRSTSCETLGWVEGYIVSVRSTYGLDGLWSIEGREVEEVNASITFSIRFLVPCPSFAIVLTPP